MKILALDPATHTGWAHTDGASGVWDLSVRRDESGGMRMVRLKSKLNEIKRACGVDLVVFEAARHAAVGMQGALVYQSELQGVIKLWCEENDVEFRGYSPAEIKKHATGKGNANKEKMLAAAQTKSITERWGLIQSGDQADAVHLMGLIEKEIDGN